MSLEDKIVNLTSAIEANTAALLNRPVDSGTNTVSAPAPAKGKGKAAKEDAPAPKDVPGVSRDEVYSAVNTLAGLDRDATIATLKSLGVAKAGEITDENLAKALSAFTDAIAKAQGAKEASFV